MTKKIEYLTDIEKYKIESGDRINFPNKTGGYEEVIFVRKSKTDEKIIAIKRMDPEKIRIYHIDSLARKDKKIDSWSYNSIIKGAYEEMDEFLKKHE